MPAQAARYLNQKAKKMQFIIGFVLSFVGSMPLGLINVTVAETSIKRGLKVALRVAAGAAMVEFFQAFLILRFSWLLVESPGLERWFHYFALVLFFFLAFYYFFIAKPVTSIAPKDVDSFKVHPFWKGAGVSSLNFMVVPYWLFYGAFLSSNGWMRITNFQVAVFSLGVSLGAFTLFYLYAKMGRWVFLHASRLVRKTNAIVGWIFFGLGGYQLYVVLSMID